MTAGPSSRASAPPSAPGLARLTRDWRVRIVTPVFLIHAVAFLAMYYLTYRLTLREVIAAYEHAAAGIFLETDAAFHQTHDQASILSRLTGLSEVHPGVRFALYDEKAAPLLAGSEAPSRSEQEAILRALETGSAETAWSTSDGPGVSIVGIRKVRNEAECRGCHAAPVLGALVMRKDLTPLVSEASRRILAHLAVLVTVWFGLALGMTILRQRVIGEPVERMHKDLDAAGAKAAPPADLDTLARRLHDTVWDLLERERRRKEDITRQMARAEQLAALGTVAAGLSHEIKNPLAGIRAAIEAIASEGDSGSERRRIYGQMLAELDRVTRTVEGLLRLARPQAPCRLPTRIERLARAAATLVEPQLRQKSAALDLRVDGELPTLELDPDLISQLILNLLQNSAQAVGGGGAIALELQPFPKGDGIVLTVRDDGHGIPAHQIESVFEPFFTTKSSGTGLGLPICRQIVEQHGGTMTIESKATQGTRVVVLLPARALGVGGGDGTHPSH